MGFLSGMRAMAASQKIKNGGFAKISIGQITNLIINLPDANRKLSKEEFSKVYELFLELQKCKTKIPMDYEEWIKTAKDIIKRFDKIAPYEKYSGGNELEFSFLMDDIRNE